MSATTGSSPLTRGKQAAPRCWYPGCGLIPAHAGKTWRSRAWLRLAAAHPRSRGENEGYSLDGRLDPGSSPLTRGKLVLMLRTGGGARLIPAHAGKTPGGRLTPRGTAAHPRSRGENPVCAERTKCMLGSSPLTRGKRGRHRVRGPDAGLIPAHAGKTTRPPGTCVDRRAHPRSRGENNINFSHENPPNGSSPLTRGKHALGGEAVLQRRLIPAHAGKTLSGDPGDCPTVAHPRSRGENSSTCTPRPASPGSSPLTRGKLQRD